MFNNVFADLFGADEEYNENVLHVEPLAPPAPLAPPVVGAHDGRVGQHCAGVFEAPPITMH